MDCHLKKRIVFSLKRLFAGLSFLCMLSTALLSAESVAEPTQISVRYAKNFTIEQKDGFQIVTVSHAYQGAGDEVSRYALIPRG